MQDALDMDYFALIRHRQEQKRDAFLARVLPTKDSSCYWDGCNEQSATQCKLGALDNVRECRFCWHHYAEVRNFVMDLTRYEKPEQGS